MSKLQRLRRCISRVPPCWTVVLIVGYVVVAVMNKQVQGVIDIISDRESVHSSAIDQVSRHCSLVVLKPGKSVLRNCRYQAKQAGDLFTTELQTPIECRSPGVYSDCADMRHARVLCCQGVSKRFTQLLRADDHVFIQQRSHQLL